MVEGEGWGKGKLREYGIDLYTLLYLKWITTRTWMGGEFGEERIHTYVWLSPFAVHLKLSRYY